MTYGGRLVQVEYELKKEIWKANLLKILLYQNSFSKDFQPKKKSHNVDFFPPKFCLKFAGLITFVLNFN